MSDKEKKPPRPRSTSVNAQKHSRSLSQTQAFFQPTLPFSNTKRRHSPTGLHGLHINIYSDPFRYRVPTYFQKLWQESRIRPYVIRIRSRLIRRWNRASRRHRWSIYLLLAVLSVFILRLFFGGRPQPRDDRIHESHPHDIEFGKVNSNDVDMMEHMYPNEGRGKATAILLNWSRLENMVIIVRHLCQYDMFKNVMVWNNNGEVHLTTHHFRESQCPPRKLLIHNSPGNMHFIARYIACSMASTPYCYFQDDDWIIRHIRSMYANFLRFPDLIHTDTNSDVYSLTNWKWCFMDDAISLHACFSWVGTGAFASRTTVVNFLKLASITEMDPTEFAFGDMYFTTFMNQVPYQLENELMELPQENPFSGGTGRIRNKVYMHKALTRIHDHLTRKTGVFETNELSPKQYQRDVRSPCQNDRCLFLTNKHSFPDVRLFKYHPLLNISESERMHDDYQDTSFFVRHPYSHAVNGNINTVWWSTENIKKDNYIGLDLLLPIPIPIMFHILTDHDRDYFYSVSTSISFDGNEWVELHPKFRCRTLRPSLANLADNPHAVNPHLLDCTFRIADPGFRFVRLRSTKDLPFPYGIYDFSFHGRVDKTEIGSNGKWEGENEDEEGGIEDEEGEIWE